jgi:hypothetical protein
MSKLVNPVADQKAKKEAIQLVDPVNESQVRHLRLLEKCQVVKKQGLNVKKLVVSQLQVKLFINTLFS